MPRAIAAAVTPRIPQMIAPRCPRAMSPTVSASPASERSGPGAASVPSVTNVASFATTIPALRSPRNAMKSPIPPATAVLIERGIASTTSARTRPAVRSRNATPERKTAPSAVCHGTPIPSTTV